MALNFLGAFSPDCFLPDCSALGSSRLSLKGEPARRLNRSLFTVLVTHWRFVLRWIRSSYRTYRTLQINYLDVDVGTWSQSSVFSSKSLCTCLLLNRCLKDFLILTFIQITPQTNLILDLSTFPSHGKVCIWAKWPIRGELIPVSVAWSK